jgi:transposase
VRGRSRPLGKRHRTILNGILWVLATGVPWRDVPEHYGPRQTLYTRSARWTRDGTWDRLLGALLAEMHRDRRFPLLRCRRPAREEAAEDRCRIRQVRTVVVR